MNVNLTKFN